MSLIVLTTVEAEQAPEEARHILARSGQEVSEPASQAIIEMLTTIMVYRFDQLSRAEVESMLGITLQETRVYREIKEEGRQEGRQEGREALSNVIFYQLTRCFGELPEGVRSLMAGLSLTTLEELGEVLLDFTSLADLQVWLEAQ